MSVWIDTDMGFDDIAAILILQNTGLAIDGMSLVFGNAPLEQVRVNAAGAAKAFGWTAPMHAGRALPVMGHLETAQSILGATGIPTAGVSLPNADDAATGNAFEGLCQWLVTAPSPRRILALGPLTNLAALVLARPDLVARIDDLTWMGGGLSRGNHTASAEFNAFADPEAVAIVLAHQLPLRMVDLDFCRQVTAGPEAIEPIRAAGGRNAPLLADLLSGFISIATSRGRPAMALYDAVAAAAFLREDLVEFQQANIQVECAGHVTRGRTVVETRQSHATFNASFAATGDFALITALILDLLRQEAAR
ncbi:purine nucleosidase [Pseudorhizobium tarimense]|uniref:Purine nucleosidase n=1 Tax=Pseudorhizobium tarimense TaxID=1079109 RepID=A0ABV2HB96_9HYPH|nr:nucleoside hydrolase [Pseudorhizobium tarimense]MCJ8520712.1 nucleoside hydrolase [Pseudorhizobium tarimense]